MDEWVKVVMANGTENYARAKWNRWNSALVPEEVRWTVRTAAKLQAEMQPGDEVLDPVKLMEKVLQDNLVLRKEDM